MPRVWSEEEAAVRYRKAYLAGQRAIARGWERMSPYVGDCWLDWWFHVGWDGLPVVQAWEEFRKANERVAKTSVEEKENV